MISKVLVTGVTGYLGGRLVPLLLTAHDQVRVMVRDKDRVAGRVWADKVEVVEADALDPNSLPAALEGIEVAFYLIHSLADSHVDFGKSDIQAAINFGRAAKAAGVHQIIYMGGLGADDKALSKHLRSRHETGDALRESGVPVTEFRAAVIIGSGGISFEMIRYLVERLPFMVWPRWVYTKTQPIAVDDVLAYLMAAIQDESVKNRIIEIGGKDVLTYGQMMRQYADERHLRRIVVPAPVFSARLSAYWVSLITPVPVPVAAALIEGLRNRMVVTDRSAERMFPTIQPMSYREAIKRALAHLQNDTVETSWTDALSSTEPGKVEPFRMDDKQGMLIEQRQATVKNDAATVFATVIRIGGKHGWYYGDFLWQLRGLMDRIIGGPGLFRSRRNPDKLQPGDILDFWRVEALEQDQMVRLRAEMRLPGRAWLEFKIESKAPDQTLLTQTAFFKSKGLLGWLYWYGIYPIHGMVFSGMIAAIKKRAEQVSHDTVRVGQEGTAPGATAT